MKKTNYFTVKSHAGTGGKDTDGCECFKVIRLPDKPAPGHQKVILLHTLFNSEH